MTGEELTALDAAIAALGETDTARAADLYMQRGRQLWCMQRHAAAMADYERAARITGPDSPAAAALAMAREVMDFYHKDLYNP